MPTPKINHPLYIELKKIASYDSYTPSHAIHTIKESQVPLEETIIESIKTLWGPSKVKIAEAAAMGMISPEEAELVVNPQLITQARTNVLLVDLLGAIQELTAALTPAPEPTLEMPGYVAKDPEEDDDSIKF